MKIGVLVFTNKAMERGTTKNKYHDAKKQFGLNKILKELNYEYEYCSTATISNYTDIIVSLTSFYDVLNLVKAIPENKSANIHIGGAGCNNIKPLIPIIDTANFGRCDQGKINGIIEGIRYNSVWRKKDDPVFGNDYVVDVSTIDGLGYEGEDERSIGCPKKCTFCFYSWWNGYTHRDETGYKTGFKNYEDFFQSIDWGRGKVITALDGMTPETRIKVHKPISSKEIELKLLESNEQTKGVAAKVFNVIGFPWEEKKEIQKSDLVKVAKKIDGKLKNRITIHFSLSHFIPMQKTPLWDCEFNWNNYAREGRRNPVLFGGDKIRVYTGLWSTSPAFAAIETIQQRAGIDDYGIVRKLASSEFQGLSTNKKIYAIKEELARFFCKQEKESISNIKTLWKYRGIK